MAKPTPGPWETSRDAVPAGHVQITVYAPDGTRVATVFDREANAPLIAASLDLFAALDNLLTQHEAGPRRVIKADWHKAREALAKARGDA